MYGKLEEMMKIAIKDRSDVLPEEMLDILVEKYSEIPVFNGIFIKGEKDEDTIIESILKFSDDYKKDLDFQIMVSSRRKTLRLKQQEALENQDIEV
jgi:hypothetical protein